MASVKAGKHSLLPPRSPFPCFPPSHPAPAPRNGQRHHQRTSSESFLIEEQPSWLDELLSEPETPVGRGAHRRSSSDSFGYLEPANVFDHGAYHASGRLVQDGGWESVAPCPDKARSLIHREADAFAAAEAGMKESAEWKEGAHAKQGQSDTESKRAKQQFAQRSRVRKLQYIAELERRVHTLQAEGLGVSAELEFLDQQNLILNLENKALKQRLDSLLQEQLIKRFQHETLEREAARLKLLYQQQLQQRHQPAPMHRRSNSRDLDLQFSGLSLKHNGENPSCDPVTGPLYI